MCYVCELSFLLALQSLSTFPALITRTHTGSDHISHTETRPWQETSCSGALIHPNWVLAPAEVRRVCARACMLECVRMCVLMYAFMHLCFVETYTCVGNVHIRELVIARARCKCDVSLCILMCVRIQIMHTNL